MISTYVMEKDITLLNFFKEHYLSSNYYNKLVSENAVTNEQGYLKLNDIIKKGESIYINYSLIEENIYQLYDYKITIIYEDSEIIAVEKPQGILIHSDGNTYETLLNAVCFYLEKRGDDSLIRCLHRIDVDTTGIVLFSKNILSYSYINKQIEEKRVYKEYMALVEGVINAPGVIDAPIGRNRHDSKKQIVSTTGKSAHTEYSVLKTYKDASLLKVVITTGRTHQIRVHLAYINHPIIGDKLYGKRLNKELKLHFKKIGFDYFGRKLYITSNINLSYK